MFAIVVGPRYYNIHSHIRVFTHSHAHAHPHPCTLTSASTPSLHKKYQHTHACSQKLIQINNQYMRNGVLCNEKKGALVLGPKGRYRDKRPTRCCKESFGAVRRIWTSAGRFFTNKTALHFFLLSQQVSN
jgi:hypothetical protein